MATLYDGQFLQEVKIIDSFIHVPCVNVHKMASMHIDTYSDKFCLHTSTILLNFFGRKVWVSSDYTLQRRPV